MQFIIGMVLGDLLGIVITALCVAAKDDTEYTDHKE